VTLCIEHFQVSREQKKILEFTCRSHRDIEELAQFGAPPSAATLRDVCRNRGGRAANLTAKTKSLVRRQLAGEFIGAKSQSMAATPNLQLPEILHGPSPRNRFTHIKSYLQLNTNNCQQRPEASYAY
jgi:hypothetical protein